MKTAIYRMAPGMCLLLLVAAALPGLAASELPTTLEALTQTGLPPSLTYSPSEDSWLVARQQALSSGRAYSAADNQPPYVMLAGYFDTDVTTQEGGTVTLIAYVTDPDGYSDLSQVELYVAGLPTGVMLLDDGGHGDFSAGDEIFGFTVQLGPGDLPAGEYLLEIQARDQQGNPSDLWPYLTIHP